MSAGGAPLVLPTHKSVTREVHAPGCYRRGAALVWDDGRSAPLRSKASNRCEGCARAVAYENMTMLRLDAEHNSAPTHVLTLTSREPVRDARVYAQACAAFWRAWRRSYGAAEYCGFMEWTTGLGARSGGLRRMHGHWLVKPNGEVPPHEWISERWRSLHGAWVVELAELRHEGGIVGYLALHHEKWEQRPPEGWTGRRLRPSKGYFAEDGETRRARARLWLAEHREKQREWPRPFGDESKPRVLWRRPEGERLEAEHVSEAGHGESFASPRNRRWLDEQLARAAAMRAAEDDEDRFARLYAEMRGELALRARARRRLARRLPREEGRT